MFDAAQMKQMAELIFVTVAATVQKYRHSHPCLPRSNGNAHGYDAVAKRWPKAQGGTDNVLWGGDRLGHIAQGVLVTGQDTRLRRRTGGNRRDQGRS